MKVHLIKKLTIVEYWTRRPGSRNSFEDWLGKLKFADWNKPGDMKSTFKAADLIGRGTNRVVFDVAGNHYRMICKYAFGEKYAHLFVCWIGTHTEYDVLCKRNEQYSINNY